MTLPKVAKMLRKNIISHNKKFGGRKCPELVDVAQWPHSALRFFSHPSSVIRGMSAFDSGETSRFQKGCSTSVHYIFT